MEKIHLIGIAGSLRKGSFNRGLLRAFRELLPESVEMEILEIGNLPLYNQDLEEKFPAEATYFKEKISQSDGVIIATPEYNRSITGVLKNAIDWSSRPMGQNSFFRKTVFVAGTSPGALATALAQQNLKQTLLYFDADVMGQPEFYLGSCLDKFDADGNLTDKKTQEYISRAISALLKRIEEKRSVRST